MDLSTRWRLARPFTLLAPVVGVLSGAWIAHGATSVSWRESWGRVALACVSAMFATAASNVWNQVVDADIDARNKPSRMIPSGRCRPEEALHWGNTLAIGTLLSGWLAGPWFVVCVAAGLALTWGYSFPPTRFKARPLASNVSIALARGLLVPVAGWSLLAPISATDPWVLGSAAALFLVGAATTKDFADVDGDRAYGCRTWPVLFGATGAAKRMAPFVMLSFLVLPIAQAHEWLHVSVTSVWMLTALLVACGARAMTLLLRQPDHSPEASGNHPAWRWMYLTLLAFFVGTAVIYNL